VLVKKVEESRARGDPPVPLASFEHEDDSLTQEMDLGSLIEDCGP
jgi:hypothetical protein